MKERYRLTEPDGRFQPLSLVTISNLSIAHERFAMLLEVDAENQEKRLQLKKEKQTLQKAQEWLEGLTDGAVSDSETTV